MATVKMNTPTTSTPSAGRNTPLNECVFDDADPELIGAHRGDQNRLDIAVQLGSFSLLGTFLQDPALTPAKVPWFTGNQLTISGLAALIARYGRARNDGGSGSLAQRPSATSTLNPVVVHAVGQGADALDALIRVD